MPLIEELPTTSKSRTPHGWAYVPDTGPAKNAFPTAGRKRGAARDAGPKAGETSAKHQKLVQSRLADLEKENYKDSVVPLPSRAKERGKSKITPNVRRILTYHRTFAHYLADEEAQLAQCGPAAPIATTAINRTNSQRINAAGRTPKRATASQIAMPPPPPPQSVKAATAATATQQHMKHESSPYTILSPSSPSHSEFDNLGEAQAEKRPPLIGGAVDQLPVDPELDSHPLLKSHTPKPASARVIDILLSEPPLSYNAARAKPVGEGKPARYFCFICGYWGKIKCRKCGERICGLMECWRAHEPSCAPC